MSNFLTKIQEKSLSKTLRRICRKHKVKTDALRSVWRPFCTSTDQALIGNDFITLKTNREKRRLKGAIPEILSALNKTATACKWCGGFDTKVLEQLINY